MTGDGWAGPKDISRPAAPPLSPPLPRKPRDQFPNIPQPHAGALGTTHGEARPCPFHQFLPLWLPESVPELVEEDIRANIAGRGSSSTVKASLPTRLTAPGASHLPFRCLSCLDAHLFLWGYLNAAHPTGASQTPPPQPQRGAWVRLTGEGSLEAVSAEEATGAE